MMKKQWLVLWFLAAMPVHGEWISMFDGKNLDGWKQNAEGNTFQAEKGAVCASGASGVLQYTGGGAAKPVLRHFEFESEVRTMDGAEAGVLFHYLTDHGPPAAAGVLTISNRFDGSARPRTGSLLGKHHVYRSLVADGEWFRLRVEVRAKHARVWVNEVLVTDYVEPANLGELGMTALPLGQGNIALAWYGPQGKVEFRGLRLQRLPDQVPTDVIPGKADDFDHLVRELTDNGFPLIDFHVHLKGGLTIEEALARSRRLGIGYGVAFNCGLGFPVTDDAGIEAVLATMKGKPAFVGMQAEGREWTKMFSKEAIAKFDYVFTDGMTLTLPDGTRSRLWIPAEVKIGDKQEFMECLVTTIVRILDEEPIDIYVNPLYLPDVLQAEAAELWTEARLRRVLDALARNGVALELSNRYCFVTADFVRQAKAAGIKFTIGTNNADGNFGREDKALRLIRECGLTAADMWLPKPDGQKPVQVKAKGGNGGKQ